jgi:ELWxxDGT repeat protein
MLVKDIRAGSTSSFPFNLTNVNGTLFFDATDDANGSELWRSDGTAGGTTLVKDIVAGASGSAPQYLTNSNGTLFFRTNASGPELWRSDGTAEGTLFLTDTPRVASSSALSTFANVGGTLFFAADSTVSGGAVANRRNNGWHARSGGLSDPWQQ